MNYYFAFGSNLDRRQMRRRCPTARVVSRAVLPGHELRFSGHSAGRKGPVATVVQADGANTFGLLYELDDADLERLDAFEGVAVGMYARVKRTVGLPSGKTRKVWTYVLASAATRKTPHPDYLSIIERGYQRLGYDLKQLRRAARAR